MYSLIIAVQSSQLVMADWLVSIEYELYADDDYLLVNAINQGQLNVVDWLLEYGFTM